MAKKPQTISKSAKGGAGSPTPPRSKPIQRNGTAPGSPGKIVSNANKWRENYNPLRQLTIRLAVQLLEMGQRGDYALLQWTYRFIERRFPTLSALITRCEGPMLKFDWDIKIKGKLPKGATQAQAEAQQQTLRDAYDCIDNLHEAIKFLAHADFRGYAHIQKHYDDDGCINHLETLHQWCICRDGLDGDWFWNPDSKSVTAPAALLTEANRIGGDQLPLEDFIIRHVDRPLDEIALINFIRQNLCEKDADGFIEIYGIPGGVVTMPGNVPPGKEAEYELAAQRVAEGGSGAIPNGSSYTANDGPRGVDPFNPRFKHLDEQLIMAGTGGKLTMLAESGSGTLAGGAHTDTFEEIMQGRAQQVSENFQKQFDALILAEQHPNEPVLVYFEVAATDETDIGELAANVLKFSQAGKSANTEWINEQTGYELEDAPAPIPPGGDPNLDPAPSPFVRNRTGTPAKMDIAAAAKKFASGVATDLHPVIGRLIAISEIQDDSIFEQKLKAFYADFPQLQTDVLKDPSADRALLPIITQSFLDGLSARPKTA